MNLLTKQNQTKTHRDVSGLGPPGIRGVPGEVPGFRGLHSEEAATSERDRVPAASPAGPVHGGPAQGGEPAQRPPAGADPAAGSVRLRAGGGRGDRPRGDGHHQGGDAAVQRGAVGGGEVPRQDHQETGKSAVV